MKNQNLIGCVACYEYVKGNLTKDEFINAWSEVVNTSEKPLEHDPKAMEKFDQEQGDKSDPKS